LAATAPSVSAPARRDRSGRAEQVARLVPAGMIGPVGGPPAVDGVSDRGVGAGVKEHSNCFEVSALGRVVERRGAVAVLRTAERRTAVGVGPECDKPQNRARASARRCPGQRRAAIDVGVNARPTRDERVERVDASFRAAHESASSRISCRSSEGFHAGKPLCGR
jgi:hypothetical protein